MAFVPSDFAVPQTLETPEFRLEPLGPQHNDADFDAWSLSKEHIHATRGFEDSSWPDDRTLEVGVAPGLGVQSGLPGSRRPRPRGG